jgi:hypothetical protein
MSPTPITTGTVDDIGEVIYVGGGLQHLTIELLRREEVKIE